MKIKAVYEWILYSVYSIQVERSKDMNENNAARTIAMCKQYLRATRDLEHFHRACFKSQLHCVLSQNISRKCRMDFQPLSVLVKARLDGLFRRI